ncbi:MAG: alcohol dehydrogenase catalytic domain-containing protein [Nocardioides marinisabuli]|uniref:alcohol dehydrogenase catalytic domain-containing protein n=1 Tax=Nocardioides marinisabuli TaxID=419476 RepID=UPI0032194C21
MRAVLLETFGGPLSVADLPDPACPEDGVVVRVGATGLCRSDWHAWQGHDDGVRLPHVPGHELAGTVVEVGPAVSTVAVGDRVTTPFVLACGTCATCRRGDQQVCERQEQPGFTGWGSFAELVALPRAEVNLVRLPDEVPDDVAAGLGCRVATAYRAVAQVGGVRPGERVVVHGCGGVGLAAVMVARALSAEVYAVDPAPASRDLAARLGAVPVDPAAGAVVEALVDLTGGGADVSLDAFGAASVASASLRCLRPLGRHVQVGLLGGADAGAGADLGLVVARELQVLGSHGLSATGYPELLALVADGTLRPDQLLRDRVGLAEGARRLAALGEPGAGAGGATVVLPDR